ncbi:MAG: Rid family hydrolase [Bacteroidaceae bacterium]
MREVVDVINAPSFLSVGEGLDEIYASMKQWFSSRGIVFDCIIWSRVYLTDPANQLETVKSHALYANVLSRGAFSYVGQPLLNGAKVAVVFAVDLDAKAVKRGTPDKMIVAEGEAEAFYHSVRLTDNEVVGLTARQQTELIFARHQEWLEANDMTLKDNCVRTWLFVRDIDRNYADVMKGRNAVFEKEGLTADTHYIASTGIGGYMAQTQPVVAIDFFSVRDKNLAPHYLNALEYLNHTHEYGVAFERGVKVNVFRTDKVYISGTASIDKFGKCLFVGDVKRQTDRLFLNISQLLADAGRTLSDIVYMIVYLRDVADVKFLNDYIKEHFPEVPRVVVKADVCRPQWLVEVECVAR